MDILQQAAQLLASRLGLDIDEQTLQSAIARVIGEGSELNLADLAAKMAGSGQFGNLVQSWLGDGDNAPISANAILEILGGEKVQEFASTIGTDTHTAAEGLSDVLPQLMDRASSGGSLLDAVGGVGGLMGAASSFFKH